MSLFVFLAENFITAERKSVGGANNHYACQLFDDDLKHPSDYLSPLLANLLFRFSYRI